MAIYFYMQIRRAITLNARHSFTRSLDWTGLVSEWWLVMDKWVDAHNLNKYIDQETDMYSTIITPTY